MKKTDLTLSCGLAEMVESGKGLSKFFAVLQRKIGVTGGLVLRGPITLFWVIVV